MGFFCKNPEPHGTCRTCGHFFKPHEEADYKGYQDYCRDHAKPMVEENRRIALVLDYARVYWRALEADAVKWRDEASRSYINLQQNILNASAAQQQAFANFQNQGMSGGLGRFP